MEDRSCRAAQAAAGYRTAEEAARPVCTACLTALWAGQMVSGRAASPLGIRLLLAEGWCGDLGGYKPFGRHRSGLRPCHRGCAPLSRNVDAKIASEPLVHHR